jgi:hypothetical protein
MSANKRSACKSLENTGSGKRARTDIKTRMTLIIQYKDGKTVSELSVIHNLKSDTIRKILKAADKLTEKIGKFDDVTICEARKSLRYSSNELLDKALAKWFYQMRSKNVPMSYSILHEQALRMNSMLGENGDKNFKASNGYLNKFLHRDNFIDSTKLYGERISSDPKSAGEFKTTLKEYVKEKNLCAEQIFNCYESGLFYKCLPDKSLLTTEERDPSNIKTIKDRVSIMLCANASGNFKLPIVYIHKFTTPHCLRNINKRNLPVDYYVQPSAWMTAEIFQKWFKERFVPLVREYLISRNLETKAVLLLDNAPCHPYIESDDAMIKCMFLPANTTSLIQPMDQCVISALKNRYRGRMLREMLMDVESNVEFDMEKYARAYDIRKSIDNVSTSWDELKVSTLKNAWSKIGLNVYLGDIDPGQTIAEREQEDELNNAVIQMRLQLDADTLNSWYECDANEPGFVILTDAEIIAELQGTEDPEEIMDNYENAQSSSITDNEAYDCLNKYVQWALQQKNISQTELRII